MLSVVDPRLHELAERQGGVLSRRQMLNAGLDYNDVRRMLRRRDLAQVHPGVYVDHTGPLIWHQRAWAAVLAVWPAALAGESALRADDGPGRRAASDGPVWVAVDRKRSISSPDGVRLVHVVGLAQRVRWNLGPPRMTAEDAVLYLAIGARSELTAVGVIADAVQSRRTTADRMLAALAKRHRVPGRPFLVGVLRDVRDGTCSVLEHGYLTRVERPHGLPRGRRQSPAESGRRIYRDVEYPEQDAYVELDGRLFHDTARARDADLDRDLNAAVGRRVTLRLGWGQVFDRSCLTAAKVARVLIARGWAAGTLTPCAPGCPVSAEA